MPRARRKRAGKQKSRAKPTVEAEVTFLPHAPEEALFGVPTVDPLLIEQATHGNKTVRKRRKTRRR